MTVRGCSGCLNATSLSSFYRSCSRVSCASAVARMWCKQGPSQRCWSRPCPTPHRIPGPRGSAESRGRRGIYLRRPRASPRGARAWVGVGTARATGDCGFFGYCVGGLSPGCGLSSLLALRLWSSGPGVRALSSVTRRGDDLWSSGPGVRASVVSW